MVVIETLHAFESEPEIVPGSGALFGKDRVDVSSLGSHDDRFCLRFLMLNLIFLEIDGTLADLSP